MKGVVVCILNFVSLEPSLFICSRISPRPKVCLDWVFGVWIKWQRLCGDWGRSGVPFGVLLPSEQQKTLAARSAVKCSPDHLWRLDRTWNCFFTSLSLYWCCSVCSLPLCSCFPSLILSTLGLRICSHVARAAGGCYLQAQQWACKKNACPTIGPERQGTWYCRSPQKWFFRALGGKPKKSLASSCHPTKNFICCYYF